MIMDGASLAVIFITLNEEYHIGAAIDNVKDIASEIWVVDSGSTDNTVEIAKARGANVVYHKFENFGAQWNFALRLPLKSAWTMKMDPDERLRDDLKSELRKCLSECDSASGYSFFRVLWFMGKCLSGVKNEVVRVWRTGQCRFSDVLVNEHPIVEGRVRRLHGMMDHFDSKDLAHWLEKQNKYTSAEALMRLRGDVLAAEPKFFGSSLERRMWFKKMFFIIPGRYAIFNVLLFFAKGAWRSGIDGWRWVKCREMVMRLREYKYIEMARLRDSSESPFA